MRFVTFEQDGRASYGLLLSDSAILDLPEASALGGEELPAKDLHEFIALGAGALATARRVAAKAETGGLGRARRASSAVRLLAPIPHPAKNVFCVGRNYREHVAEGYRARGAETKIPEFPQFFTKPPTAVIGPEESFVLDPEVTQKLDYEVELGIVIGKRGRDIPAERAFDHIFGYTIINDITARDLQRRHDQWFKGKALDRSCPMGPYLLYRDAVADATQLELTLTVNGEGRQRAKVEAMIFPIPEIIRSLSSGLTLEPGDIIATGTPSGVGYAMEPPHFLAPGDVVSCEITGLGRLTTPIVGATDRPVADLSLARTP